MPPCLQVCIVSKVYRQVLTWCGRGDTIWTCNILLYKQVLYQAESHPEIAEFTGLWLVLWIPARIMFCFLAHIASPRSSGSSFSIRCSARLAALQQQKSTKAIKTRMDPISIFPICFSFPGHNVFCSLHHAHTFFCLFCAKQHKNENAHHKWRAKSQLILH